MKAAIFLPDAVLLGAPAGLATHNRKTAPRAMSGGRSPRQSQWRNPATIGPRARTTPWLRCLPPPPPAHGPSPSPRRRASRALSPAVRRSKRWPTPSQSKAATPKLRPPRPRSISPRSPSKAHRSNEKHASGNRCAVTPNHAPKARRGQQPSMTTVCTVNIPKNA